MALLTWQIVVPLLRTAQEARDLVQAAKFPPMGRRGFGSTLPMERFNPVPTATEYLTQANDALLTIVQIETKEAMDNLDAIAAVEGIDALFIGPFDLGNNIGHPILNGVVKPELLDAIGKIFAATKKAGKKCGVYCVNGEQARQFANQGYDMLSVAADATMLEASIGVQFKAATNV